MKITISILCILTILFSLSLCQKGPICSIANCPFGQGQCINEECFCIKGYKTVTLEQNKPFEYCNYKQYSRWTPFVLEFLLPTIGHFYIGNFYRGILKLSIMIGPLLIWLMGYVIKNCCFKDDDEIIGTISICSSIVFLIFVIFQFVDLIYYAFAWLKDGNGVQLK